MRRFFHVRLIDKRVGFYLMMEAAVRKEDAFGRPKGGKSEEKVARVLVSQICEIPNVFRDNCDDFATLLFRSLR